MAFPSLGDIPLIGADIFNARATAEEDALRRQREEEDRQAKRRREALSMAVDQLQKDRLEVQRDRMREELGRIREGLPPTPSRDTFDPEEFERRTDLEVERAGRVTEARERVQDEYRPSIEEEAERAGAVTSAREEARSRYRVERPDAPPSVPEIRGASTDIMDYVLANQPLAELGDALAMTQSDNFKNTLPPALRVLMDGGQVNEATLSAAWQRRRGSVNLEDARTQSVLAAIDEDCGTGMSPGDIIQRIEAFIPEAVDNNGRVEKFYENYVYAQCGG